jgi:hypothetical protein
MMGGKQILYFVGAGLSKSVEKPGKRIPLMYDFVSAMAEYAPNDRVILQTLARLEFSGAFDWPCPEAADLSNALLWHRHDPTPDTLVRFSHAMKRRPSESIEDLMARALENTERSVGSDSEALPISFSSNAPDQFCHSISRLFGHWIGWDVDWSVLEAFLRHQFASNPLNLCQHTFISFNYDLLLDRAIQTVTRDGQPPGHAHWHPSTGYSFDIGWQLGESEERPTPTVSGGVVTAGTAEHTDAYPLPQVQSGNVLVLKPHGSLNWVICHNKNHKSDEGGLLVDPDTPVFLPLATAASPDLDYWRAERQECANIFYKPPSNARFAEVHGSICLVPPTPRAKTARVTFPAKRPAFITKVHDAEKAAIKKADEILVIGWSMPVTDQDEIRTIRCCIAEREKELQSVTVINRGERPDYFERIADTFGATRSALRIFNNGFSDYVQHHGA